MNVSISGAGYGCAVSSAGLAKPGHRILGVDISPVKVDAINRGRVPAVGPGVSDRVVSNLQNDRIRAILDPDEAIDATDLSLICLGMPDSAAGGLSTGAHGSPAGEGICW